MPSRQRGAATHAVLALLTFGPASGYELKQRADNTLRFFFAAPAMSQVYAELDRLADDGLVLVRDQVRAGGRLTRVFRLSPAGRRELTRWLAEDRCPPTALKSHLALRVMLGHLAEPDRLTAFIAAERAHTEAELIDLHAIRDLLDPDDEPEAWAQLVAEWGVRHHTDQLAALDRLESSIARLRNRAGVAR